MRRYNNLLSLLLGVLVFVCLPTVVGCGGGNNGGQFSAGWKRTFGGPGVNIGNSIQQTADGGFIIAGQTNSSGAGQFDVYLLRTDAGGNELWSQTFGGPADENGTSVRQTADGGFIVAGNTNSFGSGKYDVYLVKTDSQGNALWSKTFGGAEDDIASSVRQTADGGYIIVGTTGEIYSSRVRSNAYLIKTDGNGNTVWTKTFGQSSINSGAAVQQTVDGGFIVTGTTFDFVTGRSAVYSIKTDLNGEMQWTKTFEDGFHQMMGISVQQMSDGGYAVLGELNADSGNGEAVVLPVLIKMDSGGNVLWSRTLEAPGMSVAAFDSTSDGGFIITGTTGNIPSQSIYLARTDSAGNMIWLKTLAGTGESSAYVQQTSDGGYVLVGGTTSYSAGLEGVLVIKTDSSGEF